MIEDKLYQDLEDKLKKTIEILKKEFSTIRTGRATPALLDRIMVEAYGQNMPLKQLANISAPEPRLLLVQPYDRSQLGSIEKAIQKSDLGINPLNDGKVIRLSIPALTEDRRKELVKLVNKRGEENKVAQRNIRREGIEEVREFKKQGTATEDEEKKAEDRIQKLLDKYISEVDSAIEAKTKEIMEI